MAGRVSGMPVYTVCIALCICRCRVKEEEYYEQSHKAFVSYADRCNPRHELQRSTGLS